MYSCVYLLSLIILFLIFIYAVACVSNLLLSNISLCECNTVCIFFLLLMNIWAVSSYYK